VKQFRLEVRDRPDEIRYLEDAIEQRACVAAVAG
jgi:hypothetical protein